MDFTGSGESGRDQALGPVRAVIQTQHARGEYTHKNQSKKFPLSSTLGVIKNMLVWKLQGKTKPNAFFGEDGRPVVKPVIATRLAEKDAASEAVND